MLIAKTITRKPWGEEELIVNTPSYAAKIIKIHPGKRLSLQYHEEKVETIYILDGKMDLETRVDGDIFLMNLKKGDTYHIPPKMVHRFSCPSDVWGVEILEVSTSHLSDVVRLEDDYGRV